MKCARLFLAQIRQISGWKLVVFSAVFMVVQMGGSMAFVDEFASVWYISFLGTTTGMTFLTLYILPTLLFSMTLAEDWNQHVIPYWSIRVGVVEYTVVKLLVAAVSGFLTVGLGMVLQVFFLRLFMPWWITECGGCIYELLIASGETLKGFIYYIIHYALSGAIVSMFGIFITVYIPNPFIAVAAPLSVYLTLSRLFSRTPTDPFSIWHVSNWIGNIHTSSSAEQTLVEKIFLTFFFGVIMCVFAARKMKRRLQDA